MQCRAGLNSKNFIYKLQNIFIMIKDIKEEIRKKMSEEKTGLKKNPIPLLEMTTIRTH